MFYRTGGHFRGAAGFPKLAAAVTDNVSMEMIDSQRRQARARRIAPTAAILSGPGDTCLGATICVDEPSGSADSSGRLETGILADQRVSRPLPLIDLGLLTKALAIRRIEARLLRLFDEGRLSGTVHTCIGQEWVGIAVAEALRDGDYLFSNHRGHGHYLAWTDDVDGLVAELMGRATGVCGGRGGSQHLCRDGFFSNGVQGGIVPVSAGLAMAQRLRGSGHIAVVFIGDGTLGQGTVYETLNLASKWSLPLLLVVEDNGVAQSTCQQETLAGSIQGRAYAFGIDVRHASTWQPEHLLHCMLRAAHQIRQTSRPLLVHVRTFRLAAHSKGDDDRDAATVQRFSRLDTLNRVLDSGDERIREIIARIDKRIELAVSRAEKVPCCAVTVEGDEADDQRPACFEPLAFPARRTVDAIRSAIADAMEADERIVILGEDVRDPYGGAFKVTAGLSTRFGDRVLNTPISEAAIVGVGNGLALAGYRPVVEIMFGDFLMLAADQIVNHAAKFAWIYNDQVRVPIVIRTPMGGYRGYGPTHSQSLEKHFLGLPGTRVLALHKRFCPERLYRTLLRDNDRPTLVIENKLLYGQHADSTPPTGHTLSATDEPFPVVRIAPDGERQLTIVAYGGQVGLAESAMDMLGDEDIACDLLIPTQLYPLNVNPIAESVTQTSHLLVVEEGQGYAGFGGELIAQLACRSEVGAFKAARVSAAPCPIPAAKPAEHEMLPSAERVMSAAVQLMTA